MPQCVSADIRSQRTNAVADDFFDITLGYDSVFVRLTASVLSNAPMPKFLLMGEKGSFSKFGLDVQERALKAEELPQGTDWGLESEESWGTIYLEDRSFKYETLRGDYRLFYENIAKAIQGIEVPLVKIDEAIAVLQIIEAAFESNQKGKRILLS
jgi:scyllo-inositol 2-dehydrogenase (NADP+)